MTQSVCEMLQTYKYCLDRDSGARVLEYLFLELGYSSRLSPSECAANMELLGRHVLEGVDSYAKELLDPTVLWQMEYMADEVQSLGPSCARNTPHIAVLSLT